MVLCSQNPLLLSLTSSFLPGRSIAREREGRWGDGRWLVEAGSAGEEGERRGGERRERERAILNAPLLLLLS